MTFLDGVGSPFCLALERRDNVDLTAHTETRPMPKHRQPMNESRLTLYAALTSAERVLAQFDALPFRDETTLTLSQKDVAAGSAAYRFVRDALKRFPQS